MRSKELVNAGAGDEEIFGLGLAVVATVVAETTRERVCGW